MEFLACKKSELDEEQVDRRTDWRLVRHVEQLAVRNVVLVALVDCMDLVDGRTGLVLDMVPVPVLDMVQVVVDLGVVGMVHKEMQGQVVDSLHKDLDQDTVLHLEELAAESYSSTVYKTDRLIR